MYTLQVRLATSIKLAWLDALAFAFMQAPQVIEQGAAGQPWQIALAQGCAKFVLLGIVGPLAATALWEVSMRVFPWF